MKKILSLLCVIMLLITISGFSLVAKATSGDTFTHADGPDGSSKVVLTKESYIPQQNITAESLNLEEGFKGLSDVCCGPDGKTYLLCSEISKVIVLKPDYTLDKELIITDDSGTPINFTGAKGIYVDSNSEIFISDTNNERVIVTNSSGKVLFEIKKPDSSLIPDDFMYQPCSIAKDSKGYMYILCMGCYYGALTFSPDGEFLGFYGANTVETTALDTLAFIWNKITGTDAKRESSSKKLPYSFVDLIVDHDDFAITCTGTVDPKVNGNGQIRKISPTGVNILYKRNNDGSSVSSDAFNFLEASIVSSKIPSEPQNIVSLAVNEAGYMFALDKTVGLVYVYDQDCNSISVFGGGIGVGDSLGLFSTPEAVTVNGDSVLVADSKRMSVTVFDITEYGKLVQNAQTLYLKGDYDTAKPYFEKIIKADSGNQLAYRGLAVASYGEGDYSKALEYAKKGLDYSTYNAAWQIIFKDFLAKNFGWLLLAVFVIIGTLIIVSHKLRKNNITVIKSQKVKTMLKTPFHPFDTFTAVKYKGLGSVKIASVIVVLFYLVSVLETTASGFLFLRTDLQHYNTLVTLAKTIGIVLLWAISNWLVCTLFSGIGKLKEIYISTSYALIPMICFIFLRFALSYVLPLSAMSILEGIRVIVLIYTFFLLSIGLMTVHEFSFSKFIGTGAVTVFCMVMVVFIVFMVVILLQQFWNFAYSIVMEAFYR